jgi:nitroreductase
MGTTEDFYSLLSTTRSIRRISDQPIDDDALRRVLQAAIWAPSGGNRQPWRIVVARDRDVKHRLGKIYEAEWAKYVEMNMARVAGQPDSIVEATRKGLAVGTRLAESLADVPVVAIFVFDPREVFVTDGNLGRTPVVGGASLYPAVQNLLLAARAEGLGGVLTTLIASREPEVRDVLGIPEPWGVYAMVPLGHPRGSHGPLRRAPFEHMIKFDSWGD